jgi:hypothetical protein
MLEGMPAMTPEQEELVTRRAKLIRLWPVAGTLMSLLLLGFYTYAFQHLPIYVNPDTLAAKLQAMQMDMESMAHVAVVGGMSFVACGILIFAMLGVMTLSLGNEKRFISLIRAQEAELTGLRLAAEIRAAAEPAADTPADAQGHDV